MDEAAAERALACCRVYAADGSDPDDDRKPPMDFFTAMFTLDRFLTVTVEA
jgi:hypothetical protein